MTVMRILMIVLTGATTVFCLWSLVEGKRKQRADDRLAGLAERRWDRLVPVGRASPGSQPASPSSQGARIAPRIGQRAAENASLYLDSVMIGNLAGLRNLVAKAEGSRDFREALAACRIVAAFIAIALADAWPVTPGDLRWIARRAARTRTLGECRVPASGNPASDHPASGGPVPSAMTEQAIEDFLAAAIHDPVPPSGTVPLPDAAPPSDTAPPSVPGQSSAATLDSTAQIVLTARLLAAFHPENMRWDGYLSRIRAGFDDAAEVPLPYIPTLLLRRAQRSR
ncbi:MAG: hypothetical protein J2P25_20870 [Nocardiopsaceae bacterium]|nr:hypothetical protein [Nocardiopsaceae bacterium]